MKREYIKVPPKLAAFGLFLIVGLFVVIVVFGEIAIRDYRALAPKEEIRSLYLTGDENFGSLRGAVFYDHNRFIPDAILVKIDCANPESYLEQRVDKSTLMLQDLNGRYKLSDVHTPYTISKGKDSLIHVRTIKCEMVFKLLPNDGPY